MLHCKKMPFVVIFPKHNPLSNKPRPTFHSSNYLTSIRHKKKT